MDRKSLLFTIAMSLGIGAQAQMVDVTSQYISNAGFEECDAVEITECKGYGSVVHGNGYCLMLESGTAHGYDYTSQGWQLVSQNTNANGGVVGYGGKVQYSRSGYEDVPAAGPTANSGSKALCFCGNNNLIYKQPSNITLPAGSYKMTVYVYPYNGAYSTEQPTTKVKDFTGFVDTNNNEYFSKNRSANKEITLNSNAWNEDVIEFELTQETTGRFQVSYGIQYFLVVDDVKLEYQGGVVTTSLQNVITKAQTLNEMLNDADLLSAIQAAQAFVNNPTSQDDVATQVETLYTAMSNALVATTQSYVNLTSVYVDNWSFEDGKADPWVWGTKIGAIEEPANADMLPYIDGSKIVAFAQNGTNSVTQTISNLPAGYYLIDAKLNKSAELMVGTVSTKVEGGVDPIMIHAYPDVYQATTAGDVMIGAKSTAAFRADAFRLFYAKDEASLLALALSAVQADATAILNKTQYANVTGEERSELLSVIEGDDGQAIVTAVNAFVNAKDAYDKLVKAKTDAAAFTASNYPYAKAETLQLIQTLISTEATSRSIAQENAVALANACTSAMWENAYCEGVKNTDCTGLIVGADATGSTVNTAWTVNNISILTLAKNKARTQRDGTTDRVVYGTPDTYNSGTSSIQQTLSNLPTGKYVVAVSIMAASNLPVAIRVNNQKIATFTGTGHYASNGWNEVVCNFELTDASNVTLRLDEAEDSGTKLWYADNFRLFRLETDDTGINTMLNGNGKANNATYDLSGRRVIGAEASSSLKKGLYIVNGKKVVVK